MPSYALFFLFDFDYFFKKIKLISSLSFVLNCLVQFAFNIN